MNVNQGFKHIGKLKVGVQWYMMKSYDFVSNSFKYKNENGEVVSFNGQSITFRISIKEV